MKIQSIKKLKSGKYKIKIDDFDIVVYDEIIIKYNILYKKAIDSNLLNTISKEINYYDNYNKALKYSLKKVRSKEQIRKFLNSKNVSDKDIDKIVSKLEYLKIVDDNIYIKSYINDKMIFSKDSINKIKNDLIDQGFDVNIINNEINKIESNEIEKLEKLVKKRIKINHKDSSSKLKSKIVSEFLYLGYEYDDIVSTYDSNKIDDYSILIKEYNKLKHKYSKYDKEKQHYTIKNKLYLKGFNYDDIKVEDL